MSVKHICLMAWQDHVRPHNAARSQELVLTMIASPVLLSWDQLVARPAMRKRAGRGGKGACAKQRQLRTQCFQNSINCLDLSDFDYDWRLLLKTMPSLYTRAVIGPGVVQFTFRLLDTIDCNYAGRYGRHWTDSGQRHVFEMSCASGDQWHMRFHRRGNCDLQRLPFHATQHLPHI